MKPPMWGLPLVPLAAVAPRLWPTDDPNLKPSAIRLPSGGKLLLGPNFLL